MRLLVDRTSGRVFAAGASIASFLDSLLLFQQFVYSADYLPEYYYRAYIALLALDADLAGWDLIRDIALGVSSNFILLQLEIGG